MGGRGGVGRAWCIYTHTYIYIHTYIYTYIYGVTRPYVYIYIYIYHSNLGTELAKDQEKSSRWTSLPKEPPE